MDNTRAFVEGKKANNVLLFGDSGTGKSTSIKAIVNEFYDQGLRMIEIYKHYRFYPCNYVAYDMLTGTRRFSEHYGLKDKKQFEDYLQGQLDKIVLPNKDEAFLRTKILEMYTNPLKNFFANQE